MKFMCIPTLEWASSQANLVWFRRKTPTQKKPSQKQTEGPNVEQCTAIRGLYVLVFTVLPIHPYSAFPASKPFSKLPGARGSLPRYNTCWKGGLLRSSCFLDLGVKDVIISYIIDNIRQWWFAGVLKKLWGLFCNHFVQTSTPRGKLERCSL